MATDLDLVEDIIVSSGLARIGVDMDKGLADSGKELTGVAGSYGGVGGGGSGRKLTGVADSNRGVAGGGPGRELTGVAGSKRDVAGGGSDVVGTMFTNMSIS